MILNNYIITYLVCSLLSLFMGIIAALNGFAAWRKWDINNQAEEQYRLEKKVYLIITILSLGFLLRLLMIPLWFRTLQSMIISISGAMCLVGVHNAGAPYSYISSSLKLVLPVWYGYWLILNLLDRKIVTQPFMKNKLAALTPLGILIILETVLDASFFFSTPPRQVSCCTSLFDVPRDDMLQIVTESTWLWVYIFYALSIIILAQTVYFLTAQKKSALTGKGWWFGKKTVIFFEAPVIIFLFATLIIAFQTKISPLFLHLPFHHCIFCLCQEVWDALLCFCMIFAGLSLLLIYFSVVCSSNYKEVNTVLSKNMTMLLKWSACMTTGGLIILSIHLIALL